MSRLTRYLTELRDAARPVVPSGLTKLSDLSPEEVEEFREAWPGIEVARRRQVVNRLIELAEDDIALDFDPVFAACLDDPDGEVKAKAIEGLWYAEEPALIAAFIRLLVEDETEAVRAAAATGLGQFAYLAEVEEIPARYRREIEQALVAAFNREGEGAPVRRRALEAVSAVSSPVVDELIRQAYSSDSLDFRVSALFAMGRNYNPVWLPTVLKELTSPHPQLRFEAARASGELEAQEAVPTLVQMLCDSDIEVKLAAVTALGHIGGADAREALEGCLEGADEATREVAQEALEEMDLWEHLPGL